MGLPGFSAEASLVGAAGLYTTFTHWTVGSAVVDASAFPGIADLFCGGLGQRCCRAPEKSQNIPAFGPLVSCGQGLGCDISTNTCVASCGGPGQPCCDGPETRAPKWTADGRIYSPNSWNMREMCNTGACEKQSHRCFSCGNADGAPCCPPDAAQATARCIGERLSCAFDPWGLATSGTCHKCGIKGREPCSWDWCEPGLGIRNGLCDLCGGDGQFPCDKGCNAGFDLAGGLCRSCGNLGQIPCDSGCKGSLRLQNGLCAACGNNAQPPCDTGCNPGTILKNGVCMFCGHDGQPPCPNGCAYPLKLAAGVCRFCGAKGQVPCDTGCDSGLTNTNGTCQPPPVQGPDTCAHEGETCVADFVNGMHCCKGGSPLLCVYGKCKACVPHGEECKLGGSQTCCQASEGDQCVLDQFTGKAVCGIPG